MSTLGEAREFAVVRERSRPSARRWSLVRGAARAVLIYASLLALAALFLLPLFWMLATAFKPQQLVYRFPPQWVADDWTLANFRTGWNALPFGRFFVNTTIVTVLTVLGTLLSSSLAGFGFARYRARGSGALFVLLLATMMVPPATTLIPRFVIFSKIGWTDSWLPLIVPAFFAAPFYVFLFRQFFRAIPAAYFDAAEIDGCSALGLWWRIGLPLAKPAIAASTMFAALTAWNDYTDPLVFLSTMDKFTLQLGLASFKGQYVQQLHLMMPMALLGLLPVIVLVLAGQRWLMHGLASEADGLER